MKEITVVTDNHAGVLADITELLARARINLETIDAETVGNQAILCLSVDRYDDALRTLAAAGYSAMAEDAVLVRIDDEPGSLARIAHRFKEAGINLRSVRMVHRDIRHKKAVVAIGTERTDQVIALVKDVLIE